MREQKVQGDKFYLVQGAIFRKFIFLRSSFFRKFFKCITFGTVYN